MSAYSNEKGSQALSSQTAPQEFSKDFLPSLPQVSAELESFFTIARQIEVALGQERGQVRWYREELKESSQRENKLKSQLGSQLASQQHIEKAHQEELNDLFNQNETLRNEKKKSEIEMALLKSTIEHTERNEGSLKSTLKSFQMTEKNRIEHTEHLTQELNTIRNELNRYKRAWGQISSLNQKAKETLHRSLDLTRKIEELSESIEKEKSRREYLEELLRKEKREKQVALTCLHSAETNLSHVTRDLDEIRRQKAKNLETGEIQLKF